MEAAGILTKEQFVLVATTLVSGQSTNEQKQEADTLLTNFYKTPQAWEIVQEILSQSAAYTSSVQLSASKILRVKLFYYFSELKEEHYPALFEVVINSLKTSKMKPVRGFLADCLICLYMRLFKVTFL